MQQNLSKNRRWKINGLFLYTPEKKTSIRRTSALNSALSNTTRRNGGRMGRIFGRIIMTLCCVILLAATSQAKSLKEVYLKDGGIIKCQKVWKSDGKVMVLVNRDTLVDLSKSEVDLRKTFSKKFVKAVKKRAKLKKKYAHKTAAANLQPASEPPVKPVVSVAKPAPPAAKAETPTPPAAGQPQGAKPPALGTATSAKKVSPGPAATSQQPSRPSLPIAKAPAPQPEQKPILENNMVRFALVVLLVILVISYLFLKKKP
jgi:hypothetical protein